MAVVVLIANPRSLLTRKNINFLCVIVNAHRCNIVISTELILNHMVHNINPFSYRKLGEGLYYSNV